VAGGRRAISPSTATWKTTPSSSWIRRGLRRAPRPRCGRAPKAGSGPAAGARQGPHGFRATPSRGRGGGAGAGDRGARRDRQEADQPGRLRQGPGPGRRSRPQARRRPSRGQRSRAGMAGSPGSLRGAAHRRLACSRAKKTRRTQGRIRRASKMTSQVRLARPPGIK
jgi:hypothetical protein